jgi:hypothetical protein
MEVSTWCKRSVAVGNMQSGKGWVIVDDGFALSPNHTSRTAIAHEATTVKKVLPLALLSQDRNEVLVGLDLDALATAEYTPNICAACRQAAYVKKANPEKSSGTSAFNTPFNQ